MEAVTLRDILLNLIAGAVYISIAAIVAVIFYVLKKRDLLGGYLGGLVVGILGALIGGILLDDVILIIVNFLTGKINVNIIAAFIGSYAAVFIMNKLNHDKVRKKY